MVGRDGSTFVPLAFVECDESDTQVGGCAGNGPLHCLCVFCPRRGWFVCFTLADRIPSAVAQVWLFADQARREAVIAFRGTEQVCESEAGSVRTWGRSRVYLVWDLGRSKADPRWI